MGPEGPHVSDIEIRKKRGVLFGPRGFEPGSIWDAGDMNHWAALRIMSRNRSELL